MKPEQRAEQLWRGEIVHMLAADQYPAEIIARIAEAIREGEADMREACAVLLERLRRQWLAGEGWPGYDRGTVIGAAVGLERAVAAIRALGVAVAAEPIGTGTPVVFNADGTVRKATL